MQKNVCEGEQQSKCGEMLTNLGERFMNAHSILFSFLHIWKFFKIKSWKQAKHQVSNDIQDWKLRVSESGEISQE
jgi:hypothetical protein